MAIDCVFCHALQPSDERNRLVVYEDELVLATHLVADGPSYLGQLLLQTKRHIPNYAELLDDESRAVGIATARLSRALKSCTNAETIYVVTLAEVVPHLHTFLTSRYLGTPPEYWRMNIERWPDAPRGGREALTSLCDWLRSAVPSRNG